MIFSKCYDVEVLPNFFSIVIVDLNDYFNTFEDCIDDTGKPIPLIKKLNVSEIKNRLNKVKKKVFYITDTDDSQLLNMIGYISNMEPHFDNNGVAYRTDMFGYNSNNYDRLMVASLLMNYSQCNNTKDLIYTLYETSKKIIETQKDRDFARKDYFLTTLRNYKLPYTDVDVMTIFALDKATKIKDKDGNNTFFPKSLKQTSINLEWYELLEHELPPISSIDEHFYNKNLKYRNIPADKLNRLIDKWDRYIIDDWIPDMLHYNTNDVFIVAEMARLFIQEIRLRYNISKSYGVNVLSSSRSSIADTLFIKFYSEFSNLSYRAWGGKKTERTKMSFKRVIEPSIEFKTESMQNLLKELKSMTVTSVGKNAFSKVIEMFDTTYTMATGGLHSKDIPGKFKSKIISKSCITHSEDNQHLSTGLKNNILKVPISDEDLGYNWENLTEDSYIYVHADVASFYPSLIVNYQIAPEHMNRGVFIKLIAWLRNTRVAAKHSKEELIDGIPKKILAEALKIVINSIYGKLGYQHGDIYDRLALLQVTLNGQLLLLMLCEALELEGIKVISANTDGIVVKVPVTKKINYDKTIEWWSNKTGFELDSEIYDSYICRDVNNYVSREINGKVSYKGALNPLMHLNDLAKGYNAPIVAKAVINYLLEDKPVLETLYEATDILDFCKTQNVGRSFELIFINNIGEESIIQRNTRFYVSIEGGSIYKRSPSSRVSLSSKEKVIILNTVDDIDIKFRKINYLYYYNEALKIIDPIMLGISPTTKGDSSKGTKSGKALIKKYSGQYITLFDND